MIVVKAQNAQSTVEQQRVLYGEFKSSDLVQVMTAAAYETDEHATWQSGDWSVARKFSTADFTHALRFNTYESGAAATVPEPANLVATLLLLLPLLRTWHREYLRSSPAPTL